MIPISTTKCPKCQSVGFESYSENVTGAKYYITFIRCSSCKTAVGVMEPEHISSMIRDLAVKLGRPLNP
jgi:hypothetical protein